MDNSHEPTGKFSVVVFLPEGASIEMDVTTRKLSQYVLGLMRAFGSVRVLNFSSESLPGFLAHHKMALGGRVDLHRGLFGRLPCNDGFLPAEFMDIKLLYI